MIESGRRGEGGGREEGGRGRGRRGERKEGEEEEVEVDEYLVCHHNHTIEAIFLFTYIQCVSETLFMRYIITCMYVSNTIKC